MEVTPLPDLAPNTEFTENNNFQETLNSILMSAKKRWNLNSSLLSIFFKPTLDPSCSGFKTQG